MNQWCTLGVRQASQPLAAFLPARCTCDGGFPFLHVERLSVEHSSHAGCRTAIQVACQKLQTLLKFQDHSQNTIVRSQTQLGGWQLQTLLKGLKASENVSQGGTRCGCGGETSRNSSRGMNAHSSGSLGMRAPGNLNMGIRQHLPLATWLSQREAARR